MSLRAEVYLKLGGAQNAQRVGFRGACGHRLRKRFPGGGLRKGAHRGRRKVNGYRSEGEFDVRRKREQLLAKGVLDAGKRFDGVTLKT